ncbi:hypothetical protein CEXT_466641 [Caerostris extrusa]|uniref:Uncharacterized protein n=1 Tax=Caerostris extrusa TaxID=172846 RepID=A0AAV4U3Z0_CAEEX|nr:hypothetical protein CEXT_466641 [Caerostris extrusa]
MMEGLFGKKVLLVVAGIALVTLALCPRAQAKNGLWRTWPQPSFRTECPMTFTWIPASQVSAFDNVFQPEHDCTEVNVERMLILKSVLDVWVTSLTFLPTFLT